jgi:uncharacterized surface protein with fasciclin (FAS1) repeats
MKRHLLIGSLIASTALITAGCGGTDDAATDTATSATSEMSESMTSSPSESSMTSDAAMTSTLVGPGCADYAAAVPSGAGSVEGMAADPVATAASNNPLLKTLTAAVSGQLNPEVNLVDTLNGSDFTVFAPVDDAFMKIDPATIEGLKTDAPTLTSILTYHVVPGQIAPDAIDGPHATVQGGELTVAGSGDNITVTDGTGATANVICGGVTTSNAVVYLIDSVLMPPAA